MKRWHKFVLVLSAVSIIVFSFVVTSSAASAIMGSSGLTYDSLFAPTYITMQEIEISDVTVDLSRAVSFIPNGYSQDLGSFYQTFDDADVNTLLSFYYYSVGDGPNPFPNYSTSRPVVTDSYVFTPNVSIDYVQIGFDDYFVNPDNYNESNYRTALSSLCEVEFRSINPGTMTLHYDMTYVYDGELYQTSDSYSGSSLEDILETVAARIYLNFESGLYLSNVYLSFYPTDVGSTFYIDVSRSCAPVEYSPSQADLAINKFSSLIAGEVIIIPDGDRAPTILESIQYGLDAVWKTSLFGTFTIGQAFSACAGLALFGWLLRIFSK